MIKTSNKQVAFGAYVKAYIKANKVVPKCEELLWVYEANDLTRIKDLAGVLTYGMYGKELYCRVQQAEFKPLPDYNDWVQEMFVNDGQYYFNKYVLGK